MAEPWRPCVTLIECFADLLALARQTAAASGGPDADLEAVVGAAARFRSAIAGASDLDLLSVRLYHRGRGGFVTRVIPRPHATLAASHSDEATNLTEEQFARIVHLTGEDYLGYAWDLEPESVARHWSKIAGELTSLNIPEGALARLTDLVREEHRAAPAAPPVLPMVYRPPNGISLARRRGESRARRAGYQVDAAPVGAERGDVRRRTDQFFFAPGEPDERSVTKVAGLPYRAAGLPWPLADDGRPMTFLAQFCFAESRDLVGKLPGDILLIFAEDDEAYLPNPYDSSLRFEWHPLGLRDLVAAEAMPAVSWKLRPRFGVRYRTDDEHLEGTPRGQTKVGGEPAWIQAHTPPDGRFLCELGSWRGVPDRWDRWGGDEATELGAGEELMMQDLGCLYFFLAAGGAIRWKFQCY